MSYECADHQYIGEKPCPTCESVFKNYATLPISSHLPDMVDMYISIRAQRLAAEKEAEGYKETEDELVKTIIAKYREQGLTALGGKLGLVKMTETVEPVAEVWPGIWEFIKQNDAWDLVHKRLTITAVRDRWDAGVEIPGVGRMTKYKLSVSGTK